MADLSAAERIAADAIWRAIETELAPVGSDWVREQLRQEARDYARFVVAALSAAGWPGARRPEESAIAAVLDSDADTLREVLDGLSRSEAFRLQQAAQAVANLARAEWRARPFSPAAPGTAPPAPSPP